MMGLPIYADGEAINYTWQEVEVPDGYTTAAEPVDADSTGSRIATITNTHTPETTKISVTKVWDDANNQDGKRPANVEVELLANGEPVSKVELNARNRWRHTFENLAKYEKGEEIEYTVREVNAPAGYTVEVTGDAATGYRITNTHTPEKTQITAKKFWDDGNDRDGKRAAVNATVQLQKIVDGAEPVNVGEEVEVGKTDNWSYTWNDLDAYEGGKKITYTVVEEMTVVSGYGEPQYETASDGTITIINPYTPEETEITVTKVWDDIGNMYGKRPDSVTIDLLANDVVIREVVLTEDNIDENGHWTYTFEHLPKCENHGAEIVYSVREINVPNGYSVRYSEDQSGKVVNGKATITNSYYEARGEITFEGMKYLFGRKLTDKEFTFRIEERIGNELVQIGDARNDADGKINYPTIEYIVDAQNDDQGKHTYIISELPSNDPTITIDTFKHTVNVIVTDNGDGTLKVEPDKNWNTVDFINTYGVASITLEGTKTMEGGRELKADDFTFEIRDEANNLIASVNNDADGKFSYTINYSLSDVGKIFTYKVSELRTEEVKKEKPGVVFDETSYTVVVKVELNEDGTLKVSSSSNATALNFINTYKVPDNVFPLTATKHMVGRDFAEGDEFTFVVDTLGEAPMPEKTKVTISPSSGNDATVDFGIIKFTAEDVGKTYEYTVWEEVDNDRFEKQHLTPNAATVLQKVTVKVEDGGDGTLKITSTTDEAPLVFINEYEFSTWIPLTAFKALEGRNFKDGDAWTFTVIPDQVGAPELMDSSDLKEAKPAGPVTIHPTKDNPETINLGYLHFDGNNTGKTYTYTIREEGNVAGVTNDSSKTVTVKVTYNPVTCELEVVSSSGDQTDNVDKLSTEEMAKKTETVTFRNKYEATGSIAFKGTKTLDGYQLLERTHPVMEDEFSFIIKQGDKTIATVSNDANGNILYPELKYTLADVGPIYTYKISEQESEEEKTFIATDDKQYTVKIKVTDNGDGTLNVEPVEGSADIEKLDFVNKVKTNDLIIKKEFTNEMKLTLTEKMEEFPVLVKLTLNGAPYSGTFDMTRGTTVAKKITFTNGQAQVEVVKNQNVIIKGLPAGVQYEVTEEMTPDQKARYGTPAITNETGEIGETVALVTVKNERATGDLTLSKVLVNADETVDKDKEFSFTITLNDTSYAFECDQYHIDAEGNRKKDEQKLIFLKGVAKVKVKGGESLEIIGLPAGMGYKIEEEKMPFFKLTGKVNDDDTIQKGKTTATFTNERLLPPVSLKVTKRVQGAANDTTQFSFTITLDDNTINGVYGDMTFENGVATITLKNGESKTATDLPSGISYTVEEDVPNGYTMESTGSSGTISAYTELGAEREAIFINTKVTTPGNPGGGGGNPPAASTATPSPTPDDFTDEPTPEPTPTPAPQYTSVEGRKTWDDNNNAAGKRPASITIHLFADSSAAFEEVASKVVTEADGWSWSFTNLPVLDSYGLPIDYSVREDPVAGYTTSINGYNVTNSMQTEYTSATVVKVWQDNGDTNMRPTWLKATLYGNGTMLTSVYLGESNKWSATVDNLPVYVNGQRVAYTWQEEEVLGYQQTSVTTTDTVTTFTNTAWQKNPPPDDYVPGPQPGNPEEEIDNYGTPLGLGVIINHVGDCFD